MATISEALAIAIQHQQAGRLAEAEQIYRQVLATDENQPDAWHLLGVSSYQTGEYGKALQYLAQAIRLRGDVALFHSHLGDVLRVLQRIPEASACYRRALELKPDFAEAHHSLGVVLMDRGDLDEAVACYRRALELNPELAEAHNNLGNAFEDAGHLDEAVACYRRAVELEPNYAAAYNNLGNALRDRGHLDEAIASYRRALKLKPDYAAAYNNLGNAWKDQGTLDEALACYRQALELKPDLARAHSNLLFTLQYCAGVTPAQLAEAHVEYDRLHAAPLHGSVEPHENVPDPRRRLRLGFVSPDLRRHPVGYLLIRVLENLRSERQETICYSDRIAQDDLTHRFQAAATRWRDVFGMSDQRLAEQIRADRIDILFDLAGHTAGNRLLVFARKPAPIQVTWAGYQGTTGLTAMDYLLADRCGVPESSQPFYTEKILRMPDGYAVFEPPDDAPGVRPLPAIERRYVTFGACSNPAKVNPAVVACWAQILKALPRSRLILKYQGMDDPGVRQRYHGLFAAQGISPQRVDLLPRVCWADRFNVFHEIDIGLDTFPYSGSMTACEALWMGVPVVTWPSDRLAGRQTMGHLTAINLLETIARDLNDYVEIAESLANDLPRLAVIRAGLRQQMAASPLCDGPRFATNLMKLLRDVWWRWCEQSACESE